MMEQWEQPKTLEAMQQEVLTVNLANGWFDTDRTFGDGIALLHSEASEALEAYREGGLMDLTGIHSAGGVVTGAITKPEGVGSEYADILIRLLDMCERGRINLRAEYERKIAYNRTRGYHHGGKSM